MQLDLGAQTQFETKMVLVSWLFKETNSELLKWQKCVIKHKNVIEYYCAGYYWEAYFHSWSLIPLLPPIGSKSPHVHTKS